MTSDHELTDHERALCAFVEALDDAAAHVCDACGRGEGVDGCRCDADPRDDEF